MMNDHDGNLIFSLDFTKRAEDSGDVGGGVFVDIAYEANKGVENQEPWSVCSNGHLQTMQVFVSVESKDWYINKKDGKISQCATTSCRKTLKSIPQRHEAIFRAIEQHWSRHHGGISPQGIFPGSHGKGYLGGKISFAYLSLPAE
jgi:hypothetical protein